jgi:hypothetical protein
MHSHSCSIQFNFINPKWNYMNVRKYLGEQHQWVGCCDLMCTKAQKGSKNVQQNYKAYDNYDL